MRLNVRAFALTCAILLGLAVLLGTWWMILWHGVADPPEATIIGKIYLGYSVSWGGSFIGLIWGVVDGLIGGAIFAWLYNFFAGRFSSAT